MKTIVCFGDSNTWGLDPATGERLPREQRWTGILQHQLGPDFVVVEEGLNDRTTNLDEPVYPGRNGAAQLLPCLDSHRPIDLVVLMLGTNDLKARFARSASDVAESAAQLAGQARRSCTGPHREPPRVLLVAPVPVGEVGLYAGIFVGAEEKSRHLGGLYAEFAQWHGVHAFDAGSVVRVSELDGVHLDRAAHRQLAEALAPLVRKLA